MIFYSLVPCKSHLGMPIHKQAQYDTKNTNALASRRNGWIKANAASRCYITKYTEDSFKKIAIFFAAVYRDCALHLLYTGYLSFLSTEGRSCLHSHAPPAMLRDKDRYT